MTKDKQPRNWWQTIPSVLKGLVALIVAITALYANLPKPISTGDWVKAVIDDPDGYTNVRSGPGLAYEIIAKINKGDVFHATPQPDSDWFFIKTPNGKSGYIHRSRVKIISLNPS